jgi:hypothetical protein
MEQWGEYRHVLEWRAKPAGTGVSNGHRPARAELELYARKDGFCYTRKVTVKADGREHVIRLRHALDVFGRVVDTETGLAIRDFKALPAYGNNQTYSYDSEARWFAGETIRGTNGLFKLTFIENQLPWQVRLVADGYEDWTSDPLQTNVSSLTLDIALKRAAVEESVRGMVLMPDGTLAIGAQVALLSLEHNVRLLRTFEFKGNKRWLTTCDENGEFRFRKSVGAQRCRGESRWLHERASPLHATAGHVAPSAVGPCRRRGGLSRGRASSGEHRALRSRLG